MKSLVTQLSTQPVAKAEPQLDLCNDLELWQRFHRDHDKAAFNVLYDRYASRLHQVLMKAIRDPHVVKDLFNQLWEKVVCYEDDEKYAKIVKRNAKERRQSPKEPAHVSGLLYKMTNNLVIDHFRGKRDGDDSVDLIDTDASIGPIIDDLLEAIKNGTYEHDIDVFQILDDAVKNESPVWHALLGALNKLDPKRQEILFLRYVCGYTPEDIVSLLHGSVKPEEVERLKGNVNQRLYEIKQSVLRCIAVADPELFRVLKAKYDL